MAKLGQTGGISLALAVDGARELADTDSRAGAASLRVPIVGWRTDRPAHADGCAVGVGCRVDRPRLT